MHVIFLLNEQSINQPYSLVNNFFYLKKVNNKTEVILQKE